MNDLDFKAYKEELEKFPYYTKFTPEDKKKYDELSKPMTKMSLTIAKKHPYLWMKWVCGVEPYDYQWKMLDEMHRKKRLACVTARQIGKSFCIGAFSFWAAYNNVFPVGIDKRTKVGIVSKTESQAKKLLKDIYKMVQSADATMARLTKHTHVETNKYFSDRMSSNPTLFKLEWSGGVIEIYPPTGRVRGESLSFLIIDEADWLNHEDPDYFFDSEAMPTLKKTDGSCFLFSTPKGAKTFFSDIIRPESDKPAEGWSRIWYSWLIYEDDWERGWETRKDYIARGKELDFAIEYEAKFKSGKYTYFPPYAIEKSVDRNLQEEYSYYKPVSVGLDFGDTHSRTVVTIVTHDVEPNIVRLIYYKEFPAGYNNSHLPQFFNELRRRYNIREIVADDCVGGKTAIELLRRDGWNVKPFVFRREKLEQYELFRTAMMNGRVKIFNAPDVIAQLSTIETNITDGGILQIRKPRGGNDDIVDSLVMASSPYITLNKRRPWVTF